MNIGAAERAIVIGILLTGMVTSLAAGAADEIRNGKWQFTTDMQMPTMAQPPTSVQAGPGSNTRMTRIACINQENPVPAETQGDVHCKIDKMQRHGGTVTWAMTCTPAAGNSSPLRWCGALRRHDDGGNIYHAYDRPKRQTSRQSRAYIRPLCRSMRDEIGINPSKLF
jgi:Protein of unknown function (DUF3617)